MNEVIQKFRRAKLKGSVLIAYVNGKVEVIRSDSTRIDSFTPDITIGVYNAKADESQILEDILHHIEQYERIKAEQSKRLDAALGVLHS
ncbi:MAG: hypothetical protein Tp185DCM00d2C31949971_46 [Prokaryotic dsDNA virus sp.]|uniref:hypothetical protein n=1 Tax=Alteromonadales TaxID=135622 RepID=UPI000C48F529|nr:MULTISPECIES: hypothetical protein [Alteromonadales]MBP58922.1 hypothetical protein [Idiomarina sp.]QDP60930.1 MAG: hypothetical protein Tp185DCM00d2C31949971_46 [Prokaryotic dsDNA virus sp.]QDP61800.1 MAG: hypothetical protein Tp1111MES1053591_39 [Prokaryotic dsDNA virus sp.]HCC80390.1 hypothetical protein [Methylophaga sp.]|tara:strand:+ start:19857 stop:20123 length:267 start_codon:yes stop_codon:yes gene_type:complete